MPGDENPRTPIADPVAARIEQLVNEAPELTPEQLRRLQAIFRHALPVGGPCG